MTVATGEALALATMEQRFLRARARRRRLSVHGAQVALIGILLLGWTFAPAAGLFDPFYISRPALVLGALRRWFEDGSLWRNVFVTLQTAVMGFALGAVAGFACGIVLGTARWLGEVLTPLLSALQSIPRLALVPLFILWFGTGDASKTVLVATVVFFLVFNATLSGVRAVDQSLVNALRLMRANTWQLHTKATLPSALVWIVEGLRVSIPWALVSTVTAEIMSSNEGVGYLISRAAGQFYTAGVFAGLILLTLMGAALTGLVALLERRLLGWRASAPS